MTTPDTLPATQSGMTEEECKPDCPYYKDMFECAKGWEAKAIALQSRISDVEKALPQPGQNWEALHRSWTSQRDENYKLRSEIEALTFRAEAAEARVRDLEITLNEVIAIDQAFTDDKGHDGTVDGAAAAIARTALSAKEQS